MQFIRPEEMNEDEFMLVERMSCPSCGSVGIARVSLGNVSNDSHQYDIICDKCGCMWSVKAETAPAGMGIRARREFVKISPNRIKHMNKKGLMDLAESIGLGALVKGLKRDELIDCLLREREEALYE